MSPDIPVAAAAAARDVSSPTDFTISTPATASLGPLETVFTPASACSMLFSSSPFLLSYTEMLPLQQGRHCEGDIDMPDVTGCWPPATATISASIGFDLLGRGYYSPGIYFPIGYETACSGGHTDAGYFVWTPGPSGTAIGCCPTYDIHFVMRGYTCGTFRVTIPDNTITRIQTCLSLGDPLPVVTAFCTAGKPGPHITLTPASYAYTYQVIVNGTTTGTTASNGAVMYVPIIQLLRHDSDLSRVLYSTPSFKSSKSTPGISSASADATSLASPISSADTTSSPGTSQPPSPQNTTTATALAGFRHISKGAIAGIAIGALYGALALLGAVVYLFRTR